MNGECFLPKRHHSKMAFFGSNISEAYFPKKAFFSDVLPKQ